MVWECKLSKEMVVYGMKIHHEQPVDKQLYEIWYCQHDSAEGTNLLQMETAWQQHEVWI